ncbi:MAG: LPS export ABC transporter periplasmic protein LptC [Gilvibacter sp.]
MRYIPRAHISVITVLAAITLFACDGNYEKVRQLNLADEAPVGIGEGIKLIHTDSGKVVANMLADKLFDYSNFDFSYYEFPDGVTVYFWDEEQKMSTITSEYGIRYDQTGIVDLRKNVHVITSDSVQLNSEQLYWDQENNWVFTDGPYTITFNDGSYNEGAGFDSSQDFKIFLSRKNTGVQLIENNNQEDDEQ